MEYLRKGEKILENERGITLVALIVTIIVMMILTISINANINTTIKLNKYYNIKEDIIALTEEVQKYYLLYEELPISNVIEFNIDSLNPQDKNPNDNDVYYVIDTTKFTNLELKNKEVTYLVNEQSLTVYCKEGAVLEGKRHYTVVDEFEGGSFAEQYYSNVNLPIISVVTFESNRLDKQIANKGDTVTLKLLRNYDFTTEPVVTINGKEATLTWNGRVGKATYVVTGEETNGELIPFSVSGYEADGRAGEEITSPTFTSGVIYRSRFINIDLTVSNPEALLPDDAVIIEKDANKGIVMKDDKGNEWVWIEVPKTAEVYKPATLELDFSTLRGEALTNAYTAIENDLHTYTDYYRNGTSYTDTWYSEEQTGLTSDEYTKLKQKMLKSVYENGGFWIGRYETGISQADSKGYRSYGSDTLSEHPIEQIPVIQANAYPYNWVRCSQAQTLASSMNSGNYTSSLMFGVQWDLVMKFLETKQVASQDDLRQDSTEWGNYYDNTYNINQLNAKQSSDFGANWSVAQNKTTRGNILLTTGASEEFNKMNIYDIAGNVSELTLEYASSSSYPCAYRGGSYFNDGSGSPASYRSVDTTTGSHYYVGFRVSLY